MHYHNHKIHKSEPEKCEWSKIDLTFTNKIFIIIREHNSNTHIDIKL